mmetsp:Transcript_4748/g.17950  ORF Transcript_4748/g.17950 Transcript_4748/m.17950 type:complete len:82 (-) Transcript_4748:204-449(-)
MREMPCASRDRTAMLRWLEKSCAAEMPTTVKVVESSPAWEAGWRGGSLPRRTQDKLEWLYKHREGRHFVQHQRIRSLADIV